MRHILLAFLFVSAFQIGHAQNRGNIWYFGSNAGLDFNGGTPTALFDGQLNTHEGCATISDNNGNLLFYTDGVTVYNKVHAVMQNGFALNGHSSSTHSAIIVPVVGSSSEYYIFTVDTRVTAKGMQYSIVDMALDGGLGGITTKNVPLYGDTTEKLVAYKKTGKDEFWVLTQRFNSNQILAYDITAAGVNTTPVISAVGLEENLESRPASQIKISSNGKKLAYSNGWDIQVFDFNEVTGKLTNAVSLLHNIGGYGVEFSPDGNLLYVAGYQRVRQLNLNAGTQEEIENSHTEIYYIPGESFGSLQLGPDGKIYAVKLYENHLDVIHAPNSLGLDCDYRLDNVDIGDREGRLGLPTLISNIYFLKGNISSENFCYGDATAFSFNTSETLASIIWDFGDGNTSTLETPTHTYVAPGDYIVRVTATTASASNTETKAITIYPNPIANAVTDFELCSTGPTHEFDLSSKNVEILDGQSFSDFSIAYYPTLPDAQNRTNVLPLLYTNIDPTETIFARISNTQSPNCFDMTSFDLILKEAPVLYSVTDWTVCDTDLDGFYDFDLTEKDTEILNGQSTTTFSVSYYSNQADADAAANSLPPNYSTAGSPQEVFFRLENTVHPECYAIGSFNLEVIERVRMNEPSNFVVCDDDNDGYYRFDLTSKYNEIINDTNDFDINVTFYLTGKDLVDRTNAIDPTNFINTVPYNQNLFIRVEHVDNPECYTADNLGLVINDSPTQGSSNDWQVCDDDNDGVHEFDLTQKDSEILGNQNGTDLTITYHVTQADADAGQNSMAGSFRNSVNPQKIYYRIQNSTSLGCYLTDSFELRIFDTPTANTATPIVVCDTDETGIQTFDLSSKDDEILKGQDPSLFPVSYFRSRSDADANENPVPKIAYANTTSQETVYARIQNAGTDGCYEVSNFEIIINPLPNFSLAETYVICPDSPDLVLDGGDFENWSWRDDNGTELETSQNFNITDLGSYNLTVTRTTNGISCERTVPFEVVSSGAPVDFATEIGDPSNIVTITVNAIGTGEFEYSTDGENFQDSHRLEVFPGQHMVYVRDKFLCRTISKEIIALGYQKFFTPNNDGIHEHWNIIGAYHYPGSQLYIYNRYGKLLQQISPMAVGWDGTQNGKLLPSSDYWFRYVFDGGKIFTGHFSLKR